MSSVRPPPPCALRSRHRHLPLLPRNPPSTTISTTKNGPLLYTVADPVAAPSDSPHSFRSVGVEQPTAASFSQTFPAPHADATLPSDHGLNAPPPAPSYPQSVPNYFANDLARDAIMAYAYHLYESQTIQHTGLTPFPISSSTGALHDFTPSADVYRDNLLPLLLTLRSLHPSHIPILLLLTCTFHILGDYASSLALSHEILAIDINCVEAMSNIGTTLKAMGRNDEAYEWWWKALQIRPTYWDVLDNIVGMLFALAQTAHDANIQFASYRQALSICQFAQQQIIAADGRITFPIMNSELHRLQHVFVTTATIHTLIDAGSMYHGVADYFRAIELVIRPPSPYPEDQYYTVHDLLLATCIARYSLLAASGVPIPQEVVDGLGMQGQDPTLERITQAPFDALHVVHISGDRLLNALLAMGGGVLPVLLLLPDQVMRILMIIFQPSVGVLPSICTRATPNGVLQLPPEPVRQQTNVMTSTLLLTLAKKFQDNTLTNMVVPGIGGTLNISTSLVVIMYYLALALAPSPSTYNNLGILLSTLSPSRIFRDSQGNRVLTGSTLARMYYQAGLQIDPDHPHLLTNLGSLFKDEGETERAIELYTKAIQQKLDFDIALANLANVLKDIGRPWDAIEHYRRAVDINPDLTEATCGLVNSLCSVCDWRGRGGLVNHVGVDDGGNMIPPREPDGTVNLGWILKIIEISARQLEASYTTNVGMVKSAKPFGELLGIVQRAKGRALRTDEDRRWSACFQRFYDQRATYRINEAGFLIRFIDWIQPRLQRQWYIRAFGKILSSTVPMADVGPDFGASLARPLLPGILDTPPIPSVLPFHTFTYPLSARTSRLIAHRNSLRLSHLTLTQSWLSGHVIHPPPPPVKHKLNIGYISNDVNNHPLAHLMQSVFGFHDRERFNVFLYTTSEWDGSTYRPRISSSVEHFLNVSSWTTGAIVEQIIQNQIHILINLGGYTKGARNDIFAARSCPVQMQLMGYAGTLGAGWCDYLVCDQVACPREMCVTERWRDTRRTAPASDALDGDIVFDLDADADPECISDDWHTVMVTDHKQSFRQDEQLSIEQRISVPSAKLWHDEEVRRADMRRLYFPNLSHYISMLSTRCYSGLGLYIRHASQIDPDVFVVWLRILEKVPNSVLWLLRFPEAGEEHILRTAKAWAGDEVAARIQFSNVVSKEEHVHRTRVADLFLDTIECNAHTIAADVLWTGTPILTLPRYAYKMCSRIEDRAVTLARSIQYVPEADAGGAAVLRAQGELIELRRNLYLNRDTMPLFDTKRWTRNLEKGLQEAWRRWVEGTQFEMSDEWDACEGPEKEHGYILVPDDDPVNVTVY
ncbi:TPR-like protein [Amylocystis lapponica]|nr:TPR-like protein [Amylocystis lapponica]